ncbi:MAG: glutaminyl-peptide cyclotransferase [Balneolaceae bacterium]|nr:glutaminyl-peptide cyclotransferase [Balneolaceae bacterium]
MNRIVSIVTSSRPFMLLITTILLAQMKSCPSSAEEHTFAEIIGWEVVGEYPHDPQAFTQGLIFRDGYFYESTGRRGESDLRKVDPETGEVIRLHALDDAYFGEGLTEWNGRLIQLTLSSEIGFVYDMESFETIETFHVEGEAWGLTNNHEHLIMSDGSSYLRYLDPETFQEVQKIRVMENGQPLPRLNELEMIDGYIFANVLSGDHIAIIDPETGIVVGRLDLKKLADQVRKEHTVNVTNGIAYDSINGRIFVTGKLWPVLYEIAIDSLPPRPVVDHENSGA